MNDLVLEFDMEEVLVIEDFVDPTIVSTPALPEAAIPNDSGLQSSLEAAREAILSGKRLIV